MYVDDGQSHMAHLALSSFHVVVCRVCMSPFPICFHIEFTMHETGSDLIAEHVLRSRTHHQMNAMMQPVFLYIEFMHTTFTNLFMNVK